MMHVLDSHEDVKLNSSTCAGCGVTINKENIELTALNEILRLADHLSQRTKGELKLLPNIDALIETGNEAEQQSPKSDSSG